MIKGLRSEKNILRIHVKYAITWNSWIMRFDTISREGDLMEHWRCIFQVARRTIQRVHRRARWARRRARSRGRRARLSRIISSRPSRRVSSGRNIWACRTGWSSRPSCNWPTPKWRRGTRTEGRINSEETYDPFHRSPLSVPAPWQ